MSQNKASPTLGSAGRNHDPEAADLIRRLAEVEETLQAIRSGQVDAVVDSVSGAPPLLHQAQEALRDLGEMLTSYLERRRAEEARAAGEARFRVLAETTSAAIFIAEDMRIAYANDAAQGLTGYACDELLNMELWQFAHPTYQDILKRHGLARSWAENIPSRFELRILTKAGEERWWDVTAGEIEYEGRPASVVTAFDITERDRAEKALQKAKEELEVRVAQRTVELREANEALRTANEELREQAEELQVAMEELAAQNDELRSTQLTLEAERRRYQELFDFAPGGYLVTDLKGVIHEANRAATELLHMQAEWLVGKPLLSYVAPREHLGLYALLSRAQQVGPEQPAQWETHLQPRDHAPFPAAVDVAPVRDLQGRAVGLRWLLRDITERKRAEEEIAHVAKFPSENPNPVLRLSQTGVVLYANEASQTLLQEWKCAVGDSVPSYWRDLVAKVVATRATRTVDIECGERVYSLVVTPIAEAGYVNLYGQDITERKRMGDALKESERRFRLALKNAPVSVATQDRDLRFTWAYNQRTARPEDIIGKTDADLFAPEDAARLIALKRQVLETGEDVREQLWLSRPGGPMFLDLYLEPIRDEAGQVEGVGIATVDLTERKQAEIQREQLLAQVEQHREHVEALAGQLQAERDVLHTIMENTRTHLAYLDPEFNFVRVNSTYAHGSGHTQEELLGHNHFDLFPNAENQAIFEQVRNTGQPVEFRAKPFEFADQPERGVAFWDWTLVPVNDRRGQVQGLVLSLMDVTENVRAAKELRQALEDSRQRQAEVSALLEGSRAVLESRSFNEAAQTIFEACKNLMGTSGGYVALLTEDGMQNDVVFLDSGGLPCTVDPELPMPIRGLRERAIRSGQAVYENNFTGSEWATLLPDGHVCLENVLFVPLMVNGVVVGLMGLGNKAGDFTENDARLASAFAEQAAIALFNSRALEALRRARDELEQRVQERTAELTQTNAALQAEIVERRRAEEAVKAERQRFLDVLEMLPAYLVLLTPDYHVSFANRFFRERFGESHGQRCYEYLFGRSQPCEVCETYKVLKTISPLNWDWTGPDGRNYAVSDFPFTDTDGSTLILEMGLDVTEQKRAEEALRFANAYNRSLIEASLDPLVTIGPDGKITDVNLATEAATGCSRAELVGTDFAEYFSEPDLARAGYQAVFRAGSVRDYALELLHRDGRATSVLYNASVYRDEAGHVIGVFAAARDITARKQTEEQLRLQSTALEAVANGIIITDRQGIIRWSNPAFAQMTGYATEEVVGQNARFLRSGRHSSEYYRQLWETILSGQVWRGEMTNKRRDGSLYIEEQIIAPVPNERGELTHFVSIKQDITERKRMEEAERRARQIAETLSAANLALTQSLDLETVMETMLDFVEGLVPYDSANVMLLEAESRLAVRVTRGYERWGKVEQVRAVTFDVQTNPVLGELFTTRKSILVPDTGAQPGWETLPGTEHVRSWLGVPLIAGGHVIGIYSLDKTEPGFFTPEHVRLAEMLVGQAAVAIQNAWLFDQVRAGRERLQSLSRRLVEVQEAERRYVARELHDEAGQSLTSLVFGLGQLEQETDRSRHIARIAELKQMTHRVLEDLHRLAMDLRPASLDYLGLVPALEQYVKMTGDRYSLNAQFKALGFDGERLPPAMETALYRIVQEALTNVVRHAQATRVDVLLERRGDQAVVVIEDNGVGFDADMAHFAQSGRLGLLGMQERVEMLGGSLVIETAAGAGTTIVVEVPHANSHPHRG